MTNGSQSVKKHWALLIGINFYVKDRHLHGAVSDVKTVKEYLESGKVPVDTVTLTATTPPDPSSGRPTEEPDVWPTYSNVVSGLERVIEQGRPSDSVYIHFSGHGTRIERLAATKHKGTGDLALVLFEEDGCSYLRGEVLAMALRKMIDKGLFVTLVLDCCFSGSAVRQSGDHDVGIRTTDYHPIFDTEGLQGDQGRLPGTAGALRNANVVPTWLVDPKGYAILSACGPHEKAWELKVEEGGRRGALTYFLTSALSALRKAGVDVTHQSMYQCLRARFHASWPQQTPMRYGNGNSSFFGNLGVAFDTTLISIYIARDNRLCLSAGEAHGVCKGDEYAVYPFHEPEGVLRQTEEAPIVVRVDSVRCLTSDLVEIESTSATSVIKTGWKAKLVTNFSPRKMSVRLMTGVSDPNDWMEAAKQQQFLRLCTETVEPESCIFSLTLNEDKEYEILDGSNESVISLPTIPVTTNRASDLVLDVLQHLARFKYFERVENRKPNSTFERSFSIFPTCDGQGSGGFNVKHGGVWGLTMENLGDRPLYLAVFNCTPSWEIKNLVSSSGAGDFLLLQPKEEGDKGKQEIHLKMEIPELLRDRGLIECEDIIKIFITSKPTSFQLEILPEMPLQADNLQGSVRGAGDRLSKFLSELTTGRRGDDGATQEEWATRSFIIHTARDSGNEL